MKTKNSLNVLYNEHITSAQDDRTLEEWAKHEGSCHSRSTVAEVAKIFVISLCFYAFDISFSIFIYQIENTNNCRGLVLRCARRPDCIVNDIKRWKNILSPIFKGIQGKGTLLVLKFWR